MILYYKFLEFLREQWLQFGYTFFKLDYLKYNSEINKYTFISYLDDMGILHRKEIIDGE